MDAAPVQPVDSTRRVQLVVALVLAAAVGIAWWMTGSAPKGVDDGMPAAPPPMVLPSGTSSTSALGRAAARLATGHLTSARTTFTRLVAEDQDDVVAQTGLILSRWHSTGPRSVERDLPQLVREYPDDAYSVAHLGFVQETLGETTVGRASLRSARSLGRAAAKPTDLRLALLADDMLHDGAFRGYLPVLVHADEVQRTDQRDLTKLLTAVERNDRATARHLGTKLQHSTDPMARIAGIAGTFDKDDIAATAPLLLRASARAGATSVVRNRADLMAGLAAMWSGGSRTAGCKLVRRAATSTSDVATRRAAVPIASELCSSN